MKKRFLPFSLTVLLLLPFGKGHAESGLFSGIAEGIYRNILVEKRYLLILNGLGTTALISFLSAIFGTLIGALICGMRMSGNRPAQGIAKAYIAVLRGIPVLVLLMLIFFVAFASVNISPIWVAVLAFGANFGAYVSEMYRSGIESVEKGQIEAGIAMGFTKSRVFFSIVLPQAVRRIVPAYKGELISMVKMTSVVGYIGAQDLTKASEIIRSRTLDAFFPLILVALLYFCISTFLMLALDALERRITSAPRNRRGGKTV